MSGLPPQIDAWRKRIEEVLEHNLPPADRRPISIHQAMRYAVLGGGKRLRPILAAAAAAAVGAEVEPLLKHFAALELIHTYSLVHDDLPALDNDDLRRGRKTTHVVYGEALAILAGDALLTEAFLWLSAPITTAEPDAAPPEPREAGFRQAPVPETGVRHSTRISPERHLQAIHVVANAIDASGMIGGQVADLEAEHIQDRVTDAAVLADTLDFIHRNKTGRLLTASVQLGGLLGGANEQQLEHLRTYGESIGLAFQIVDDLLDVEGSDTSLGKTAGKDQQQGKLTWPALLGVETARSRVTDLLETAEKSAAMIRGSQNYLVPIARYIGARRA